MWGAASAACCGCHRGQGKKVHPVLCCAVVVVVMVGFMIAELAIWVGGKYSVAPEGDVCPSIPLNTSTGGVTHFAFQKDLWSRWHWRYNGEGAIKGKIEQRCPSFTHDVELSLNGKTAGRTDGKLASYISTTFVQDCHGEEVFEWDSGNMIQTFINKFRINAKYIIRRRGVIIAFVDSTEFFETTIILKDADPVWNGHWPEIARMNRKKLTLSAWTWEFTVTNASHPACDGLLLTSLAGQRSFSEGNDDATDMCNGFFRGVGYLLVAILCAIGAVLVYAVYALFTGRGATLLRPFSRRPASALQSKDSMAGLEVL